MNKEEKEEEEEEEEEEAVIFTSDRNVEPRLLTGLVTLRSHRLV